MNLQTRPHGRRRCVLFNKLLFLPALALICIGSAAAISTAPPSLPTSLDGTYSSIPRGGAAVIAAPKTSAKNGKSGSTLEHVRISQILKPRKVNWLTVIRATLLVGALMAIWESFNSVGVPYAEKVWGLLHDSSTSPMPYFYYPSDQDVRVAQSIAQQTAGVVFPSESMPSILETIAAVISSLIYLLLQFLCPVSMRRSLAYSQVSDPTGTNLAVALEVEQQNLSKSGSNKVKTKTIIRNLKQVGDEKKRLYEFELSKDKRLQWNPSKDKLTVL